MKECPFKKADVKSCAHFYPKSSKDSGACIYRREMVGFFHCDRCKPFIDNITRTDVLTPKEREEEKELSSIRDGGYWS